jgi:hypothetical protein
VGRAHERYVLSYACACFLRIPSIHDLLAGLTGDVFFLNKEESVANKLTEVNAAGNAIIRVDNVHEVAWNDKRSSVSDLSSRNSWGLWSNIVVGSFGVEGKV